MSEPSRGWRDRLGLDGRWGFEPGAMKPGLQRFGDLEVVEVNIFEHGEAGRGIDLDGIGGDGGGSGVVFVGGVVCGLLFFKNCGGSRVSLGVQLCV